jgi:hypothetical protein
MRKFIIPAALAITLAGGAAAAMADSSSDKVAVAGAGPVSAETITNRLQSQGYTIRKIKLDDGRYKVKAIDSNGHKEKFSVSPVTGDVIAKSDDDDGD